MDIIPDLPHGRPLKGRGAVSNPTGRYEREVRHRVDDGWANPGRETEEKDAMDPMAPARNPRTRYLVDGSRTVIARNNSPDIPFDRSINPYRGCEHGCIYCFARPSHAWLGMSPGLDFETRILTKPDAPTRLRAELARKNYKCAPLALGTNTDPYQPAERKLSITRGILKVLSDCNHPVTIVTKSDAVIRDLDILSSMAARDLVSVHISVTSLDHRLIRKLEPRTPVPARRLWAIRQLAEAGVPVGVMAAPIIPALNDPELEAILEAGAAAGAGSAGYILLRLPLEVKDLFEEWLRNHYPDRAEKVLNLVRDTRGGALNSSTFGKRMRGEGVYAEMIARRFNIAVTRLGLGAENIRQLDTTRFTIPGGSGKQLTLF